MKDFNKLVPAEVATLDAMVELYSAVAAARTLRVTQRSVKMRLDSAMTKMGCQSYLELILEFDRWRWRVARDSS